VSNHQASRYGDDDADLVNRCDPQRGNARGEYILRTLVEPAHAFSWPASRWDHEKDMAKKQLSPKYQVWVNARKRFHLSHAHIQMARELGMNPKRLGKKANHQQEPWKVPLPQFIERLYLKRFGKTQPDDVRSIEQIVQDKKRKQAERKARKLETPDDHQAPSPP
jgi:hypothetical protein